MAAAVQHTEVVEKLAAEEAGAATKEELEIRDKAFAALTPKQQELMRQDHLDALVIVRGYQTYKPRLEETIKYFKKIAEWREECKYHEFLNAKLAHFDEFHRAWPNAIFGTDDYGHVLTGFQVEHLDVDGLEKIGGDMLVLLQGQKMKALFEHKRILSKDGGVQRYKHSAIMDLHGLKMSMLHGHKRDIIQRLLDVGSHYFPEQMWKVYLINTPLLFRGVWTMIKPWLHPVTVAKVQMLGKVDAAKAQMMKDGIPASALPTWCGGTHHGKDMGLLVEEHLNREHNIVPC
mmetsp:Transcript_18718/g.47205  ORF Transcript_18718/g.47205 Transcript_18718/m.47205 type:complete len:289 (+) Transcript_18718:106-972(+)|eukprot:CAMPEP_0173439872 /NCGR_PEP_ID=MMETSP1357-20121228/21779_1 /TAXON_ID=77926 /ORGANISM="Hemiselmis rufescens, Strain PCC563" /LENGTH=288 /DNA_ID=CAMNT_0014405283 /DNA_START=93 /DNA_END=959 /DNA_ORIENTATION=-